MFGLPLAAWLLIAFLFGVVIGSFLNVVIYRLHTGRSLNDRSHCLSCGHQLAWYDLFPLLSYLSLAGRCRYCHSWITPRYFLVELITGLAFVQVLWYVQDWFLVFLLLILSAVLIVAATYDIYHMIIPDELVVIVGAIASVIVFYQFDWQWLVFGESILAGLIASLTFGGLWLYSRGRWVGLGDAKLAFPLGMLVGLSEVFSLVVFSFWIGALLSVLILLIQAGFRKNRGQKHLRFKAGNLTMKSEIPFAPFLIFAFVLVFFYHGDVLALTTYVTSYIYPIN